MREFLHKKIVEETIHEEGEFLSNIFLRKKRETGKYRVILNMKKLNEEFVEHINFKMDTLKTVLQLITPGCFFFSIDFSDAYYSIPVAQNMRKYLKFTYRGRLYQFTCFAQGYADAPRQFTKTLKVPLSVIREKFEATISAYLDDSINVEVRELTWVLDLVQKELNLFQEFGYTINWEKSQLDPTQIIEFLGFILNSLEMTIKITEEKCHSIISSICAVVKGRPTKLNIRMVAKMIGKLIAIIPADPFVRLFVTPAMIEMDVALKLNDGDYDAKMELSQNTKNELKIQIERLPFIVGPIRRDCTPNLEIFTDASSKGWGVYVPSTNVRTRGHWSFMEDEWHINTQELQAVWLCLNSLGKLWKGMHIKFRIDNTTAIASIEKQGDLKNRIRQEIAQNIWKFALERDLWLTPQHVAGINNIQADYESRVFNDNSEWTLRSHEFQRVIEKFGMPSVDLFASRLNHKVEQYGAWFPDPGARFINSFKEFWGNLGLVYCFPPFCVVGKVIQKILQDKAEGILIVPYWPSQPWFNMIKRIQVGSALSIEINPENVFLPFQVKTPVKLPPGKQLMALKFSAK